MKLDLRCLQIDLARQKESVAFVKSYADFAAENGYNALILYLENAVRTEDTAFFDPEETYSADEIREIVAYAGSKGLDVIPALENLGHLEKFFLYPQLEHLSEITDVEKEGRGFDRFKRGACGCITNPELNKFFDKYIADVCSLFHSKYVHMGLDEPFDLAVCERCKSALAAGKSKSDLFLAHILHTYELCKSLGKTMMMWDDFFEYADIVRDLPRDIVLCNWNYVFVGDEPQGHWTNRIKKDWFRLYDELGFSYLFCVYAHRCSSPYNVDTFTDYAEKYSPVGAIMTTWKRSDSFYQGAYPNIAYAGKKWSGLIQSEGDRVAAYASALGGSEECAKLLLSMNIVECGSVGDMANAAESDYMLKLMYRAALAPALEALRGFQGSLSGRARDVVTDAYDYIYEIYLNLRLQRLAVSIFDDYERKEDMRPCRLKELDEIAAGFEEIRENGAALWERYRSGIKSCRGAFEKKFASYAQKIDRCRKELIKGRRCGVLYVDLMLHDPYPTVHNQIAVKYRGEEESILFTGVLKPSIAQFEIGGCYGYRFAIEEKELESVTFAVWGEGAHYPLHFRYTAQGRKYVADTVEVLSGDVRNAENVLFEDTRFAEMGTDDGIAHFNDIALSAKRHVIRVTFRPLSEVKK